MVARTGGASMAHPEQDFGPVAALGPEHHHNAGLRRKARARPAPSRPNRRGLCGKSTGFVAIAGPNRPIREDHRALFNAAAKAAARSGLQSGATCSTAPAISILTIPAFISFQPVRALRQAPPSAARSWARHRRAGPTSPSWQDRAIAKDAVRSAHASLPHLRPGRPEAGSRRRSVRDLSRTDGVRSLIRIVGPTPPTGRPIQNLTPRNSPATGNLHPVLNLVRHNHPPANRICRLA